VDLDLWIREYNEQRPHQGRWCFGKTPMQTFLDAIAHLKAAPRRWKIYSVPSRWIRRDEVQRPDGLGPTGVEDMVPEVVWRLAPVLTITSGHRRSSRRR
jgi:hypothetical protein